MYLTYTFLALLLIAIVVVTVTLSTTEVPEFSGEKSENFNNVTHFNAVYKDKPMMISPEFDWLKYNGLKYDHLKYNTYENKEKNKVIKLSKHPFYYVDKPVLKNQIKKEHNIPKIIWQTMRNPPKAGTKVYDAVQTFKAQKGWEHRFVTDENAKVFLKENFDESVLHSFEVLVPGAFKADLLRACLLYVYGGVYADAKLFLHYDLDSFLERDLVLVKEFNKVNVKNEGIWNGFMASTPKQPYFLEIIKEIVNNVANLDYKNHSLAITGPLAYGKVFMKKYKIKKIKESITENYKILNIYHATNDIKNIINEYSNQEIYISWDYKRSSYTKEFLSKDYSYLWKTREVFDLELHKQYF